MVVRKSKASFSSKAGMLKLLGKAVQVVDNLKDDLGLNPGAKFLAWLQKELAKPGVDIKSNEDLLKKLETVPPGLRIRKGVRDKKPLSEEEKKGRLAMIAADVTTETKVELPKMAELYWSNPESVNPACFARASMSIPFFFHPYRVENCPSDTTAAWEKHASYSGPLPTDVIFIDGGIMSNFPVNLFHEKNDVPLAPTFGAKIGTDRAGPKQITKPAQLASAVFDIVVRIWRTTQFECGATFAPAQHIHQAD